MNTYRYRGLNIPVELIRLTGQSDPSAYSAVTQAEMAMLERNDLMKPDLSVVEVGCGFGRVAIELRDHLGPRGAYLGIDIIPESIKWAQENIASDDKRFAFVHLDVSDRLHHPAGTLDATEVTLPTADDSVDLVVLMSVFTHLLEPGLSQYLREFRRVLRPQGRVFATCFLYSRPVLAAARRSDRSEWHLFFRHRAGRGCRVNDGDMPTGAVAYRLRRLQRMVRHAGLELVGPATRGSWSGQFPDAADFQDSVLLGRGGSQYRPS